MMVNQEDKLEETELYYNDIKIDYDNLERKSREMEQINIDVQEQIAQLEKENHD